MYALISMVLEKKLDRGALQLSVRVTIIDGSCCDTFDPPE